MGRLAHLDGHDPVENGLGDLAESLGSGRDGDVASLEADATRNRGERELRSATIESEGVVKERGETHLSTGLTKAAVPLPNISSSRPSFCASSTSFIPISRSLMTISRGRPSSVILPAAWSRRSERIESRVTPGRMMSCRGGVTTSVLPSAFLRTTNMFCEDEGRAPVSFYGEINPSEPRKGD